MRGNSSSNYSQTVVYVGKEGKSVIAAIAISDNIRQDAESSISRYNSFPWNTYVLIIF